jgi:hypothetical protein
MVKENTIFFIVVDSWGEGVPFAFHAGSNCIQRHWRVVETKPII